MKKFLTLMLLTSVSLIAFSQTHFKPGYFINIENKKVDCLIKDEDWKNTPKSFEYKIQENDNEVSMTLEDVIEFGIGTNEKYVKRQVKIDKTSSELNNLTNIKEAELEEEELFLKELINGKVNLYHYVGSDFERFFYEQEGKNAEQLIYKSYMLTPHQVGTNEAYKQQLFNILSCECLDYNSFKNASYTTSSLSKLFIKYHNCSNLSYLEYKKEKRKAIFKVNLRPGIGLGFTNIDYFWIRPTSKLDFGSSLEYRFGTEAEIVLPFNNNKWAIAVEPTILYTSFEKDKNGQHMDMTLASLDINIAVRHYFFISDNTSIFVNAGFMPTIPIHSEYSMLYINPNNPNNVVYHEMDKFDYDNNFLMGAGVKHKKWYGEIRYLSTRNLNNKNSGRSINYSSLSMVFGYTIFDTSNKK